jgi:protein involved in polysaccharide export with SLBB domain
MERYSKEQSKTLNKTEPVITAMPLPVSISTGSEKKTEEKNIASAAAEGDLIPPEELPVFGQEFFSAGNASFAPGGNLPVMPGYTIGPDDNIELNVWGRINEKYNLKVQRDGTISVPQIGTLPVQGLSFKGLQALLKAKFEAIPGVEASVSMGELKTSTVFVVGAVKQPGAYTVSSFDTILNALIYAKGPGIKSSLPEWRKAQLSRENLQVKNLIERLKKEREKAGDPVKNRPIKEPSALRQLVEMYKEEKQTEDVLKRIRELDPEALKREILNIEIFEDKKDKYSDLKKFIESLKNEKKLSEQTQKLRNLNIAMLDEELKKIEEKESLQEKDYTLKQNVNLEERYKQIKEKEYLFPTLLGSMRKVQLKRQNRLVASFDLYDLLLKGDNSRDMQVQQGDIIFVPKPEATVAIIGDVKRPALYEIRKGETLFSVLELIGGINPSALSGHIEVQRYKQNKERIVLNTSVEELKRGKSFELQDGDIIRIFEISKEDVNAIYLYGNVKHPGKYQCRPEMRIFDVVGSVDALKPETCFQYAVVKRYEKPAMKPTIISFKLDQALKKKPEANILLQPYDEIYIFSEWDFKEKPDIVISGEVRNPGKYPFDKDMRVKDALYQAGGMSLNAFKGQAHIFRTDPATREVKLLDIDLGKALANDNQHNIVLQDKDKLVIHSVKEYSPDKYATIQGEIRNPGDYPIGENMSVRDLILAAGNLKESAYTYSAELSRFDTSGGKLFKTEVKKIDLKGILEGKEKDIKLNPHDHLQIYPIPNWNDKTRVAVQGEISLPGVYYLSDKATLSQLIERAGGFLPSAYLKGAVFTRESAKVTQKATLEKLIFEMEQDVAAASVASATAALSPEDVAATKAAMESRRMLIEKMKTAEVTGRVIVKLDALNKLKGSRYDFVLEDGDTITIPKEPGVVHVMGAVYNPTSVLFEKGKTVSHYLSVVGGATVNADEEQMFVIRANGSVISNQQKSSDVMRWEGEGRRWLSGFESTVIYPGDTILVPRKVVEVSKLKLAKDVTSIIYNIAISVGAMKAIGLF